MSGETKVLLANATLVEEVTPESGGKWKSGLCDCCKYGPCHKALLTAWCCAPIMLGQLLTRMKLTWLGEGTTTSAEYKNTFRNVLIIGISVYVLNSIFECTPDFPDIEDGEIKMNGDEVVMIPGDCVDWQVNLKSWVNTFFWLYTLVAMIRLRRAVRNKYNIPDECGGQEDFWCACCCPCLTAVQMAHQTADYDNEKAYFFTRTGLSEEKLAEAIVV